MQLFLDRLVSHILLNHGRNLNVICIVLPTKRAGVFVQKSLASQLSKTLWAPRIITINDFIKEHSEEIIPDQLVNLFELYDVYKTIERENAEPFHQFAKWGEALLADFNEIDRYMVDTVQFFSNLTSIQEIENWSFNVQELSDGQKKYLDFWKKIGVYYNAFNSQLSLKGMTTGGNAYRSIAENIGELKVKDEKIYFAGFNALSKSEETIIHYLVEHKKAEVLWDVDRYYLDESTHEAGLFFRRIKKKWKLDKLNWENDYLLKDKKEIKIFGAPHNMGQVKIAGEILKKIASSNKDLNRTALVLADEKLLDPVLFSIPKEIQHINITMGYPLGNTSFMGLIENVFDLHLGRNEKNQFYYKDLGKVFQHPWVKASLGKKKNSFNVYVSRTNAIYFNAIEVDELGFTELSFLFRTWKKKPTDIIEMLVDLIDYFKTFFVEQKNNEIQLEQLYECSKIVKKLTTILSEYDEVKTVSAFRSVFFQAIRSSTLSFFGEPLKGLQLMGMLETRALDFENLIILSVNENILPKGKVENSFIPFDLRKAFGLPTYKERDAIFANHFYRLLHRAKNAYLVYNLQKDDFGSGEKSRFITQLLHELEVKNPNAKVSHRLLDVPVPQKKENKTIVKQNKSTLNELDKLVQKGLSPSALNTFINCSLDFYYKYLLGLREQEVLEEEIEVSSLGTFIHGVLEDFYQPFIGKNILEQDVKKMIKNTEKATRHHFLTKFRAADFKYGKNHLSFQMAIKSIQRFLAAEMELLRNSGEKLIVLGLEMELKAPLEIVVEGQKRQVFIAGKADRIDQLNGQVRIIDYKTGGTKRAEINLKTMEQLDERSKGKARQLMIYGWLYYKMTGELNFTSGIYSLKNAKEGLMNVSIGKQDLLTTELFLAFEEELKKMVEKLFSNELIYEHNIESDWCVYCN